MSAPDNNSKISLFFAALFSLLVPVILFYGKNLDNNSLCRWNWVFDIIDPQKPFLFLIMAICASFFLAKFSWPQRKGVTILIISFLACLPFWGEPEIIMDSSRYFSQAKYLKTYGMLQFWQQWGHEISAWTDLPLIPFIYGISLKIFGESRVVIQTITTLFFCGSLLLTYQLGKCLWDAETGFIGALLLLCFPYLFLHVPLMMVDLPTMFFLLLAIYTSVMALQNSNKSWQLLAAVAIFLSCWSKYSTWLFMSVLLIVFFVYLHKSPRETFDKTIHISIITLLLIAVVFLPLRETVLSQLKMLIEYQKPGLSRWSESFISTFFFQIHPLVTFSAIWGVVVAIRKKNLQFIIPGFLILLIIGLEIKRIRYMMPVFPMLALTGAYGLKHIGNQQLKRFLIISAIGASLTLAAGAYLPFAKRLSAVNIQEAGQFLNSLDSKTVKVYTVPQPPKRASLTINIPLLDIFTNKTIYLVRETSKPGAKKDQQTSFRFTWEQKLPPFYQLQKEPDQGNKPLVIIAPRAGIKHPKYINDMIAKRAKVRVFTTNTGKFGYKTFLTIYYNEK